MSCVVSKPLDPDPFLGHGKTKCVRVCMLVMVGVCVSVRVWVSGCVC